MLTIRMQRTGRTGHAQFRVIVQDSRFSPDSGRVVAQLGSYNPHTKTAILDKEKAQGYLNNGAQPSARVISLLKNEGLKLPNWVSEPVSKSRAIKNQDKLRRNRSAEAVEALVPADEPAVEEKSSESESEMAATEAPAEEVAGEAKEVATEATEEAIEPSNAKE